ncbi:hypothetical protein DVH02_06135, partial [Streptomyces corynorhini]
MLLAVTVGALTTGCFGPQPPLFGQDGVVPEEAARVPMEVRPGADGTWALYVPELGLRGQGRSLVLPEGPSVKGWRRELPAEFAVTSHHPGAVHSAFVRGASVVLVGGREGRRGPSAVAWFDVLSGRVLWTRNLPSGATVQLSGSGPLVVAACGA